ncbi:hypothetical protein [uncultured Roseivirga sp.]|uniref:hypothetical protein n=1 Tax=uncultured Roseivirga sp. TaxID=543088 RepID=UPI0030DDDC96|tara:strand:- start:879 stop:1385 length:507 start_codon:yes stop_codon:yes gene_type:complete
MTDYIPIAKAIQNHILSEIKRTGIGPQRILKGNKEAREIGLTSGTIYRLTGQNGKALTAKTKHVELALKLWEDIPDKASRTKKVTKIIPKQPSSKAIYKSPSFGYVPITIEFLDMLKREELRTGVKAEDLVKETGIDIKPHVVKAWKSGKTKSADPVAIRDVLKAFES